MKHAIYSSYRIETKYYAATKTRLQRIVVTIYDGANEIIVRAPWAWEYALNASDNHERAIAAAAETTTLPYNRWLRVVAWAPIERGYIAIATSHIGPRR